jgi:TolB protein
MKNALLRTLIVGLTLTVATAAQALVRIDLTDANADPVPVALVDFSGKTADEVQLGKDIKNLIKTNLKNSGLFNTIDDKAFLQTPASIQANGPAFSQWRLINAQALVVGTVEITPDDKGGKLRAVYRMFDVYGEEQMIGKAYTASVQFWRHIGHRISDDIYSRITGEGGYFTTRIVFIGEQRVRNRTLKRLCVMDQDGGNYQCLTDGRHLVLTPRFSPAAQQIIYMSYANGKPRLYLLDLPTGKQEIVGDFEGLNSSPRFSPDGKSLLMTLTMGHEGNPEIYRMDLKTRKLERLTFHRGIDTSPAYSPDGKQIVFNSDRGGKPALYIMDADGNRVRRLTFGDGRYYAPAWSPRGDLIAFVKEKSGRFSIGVIEADGSEERLLTDSYLDESPSWSPNGRVIIFARQKGDTDRLHTIDLTGYNERRLETPTDASDPAWSPLLQ